MDEIFPPGVAFGLSVSNGALLIAGAVGLGFAVLCHTLWSKNSQLVNEMDINRVQDQIYADVYAYTASVGQTNHNDDRVRDIIRRMRTNLQNAITTYRSQVILIHNQVAAGQITQAQAKIKLAEVRAQFHNSVRSKWEEVAHTVGLPLANLHNLMNIPLVT